ncbi:hypothetical protein [Hymenobacter sp. PAMC 26628]|uniref:hypothetical protein n=1 Tax=Hymenobacter sp. PAMC 26628 TaxID=1484118 RepID=UPI000AE8BFEA|nr:hypothetical protein [Hymenobacter sp. PAMC 26628]
MFLSLTVLRTVGLLVTAAAGTACHRGPSAATCGTPATVRDLGGLDRCGKVLELAGGAHLLPAGFVWGHR